MAKHLSEVSIETMQQRLIEEVEAQQRLSGELRIALERERDLRLENELLWVYLQRKHPARIQEAREVLEELKAGSDLRTVVESSIDQNVKSSRTIKQRFRGAFGKLPGARRVYHGLKKLVK
jgi:hypothetical protein